MVDVLVGFWKSQNKKKIAFSL